MRSLVDLVLLPAESHQKAFITKYCAKELKIGVERIQSIRILKRSIDARQVKVKVLLRVEVGVDEVLRNPKLKAPVYPSVAKGQTVVVVGAGPAGLFAALQLIEKGFKPIILERGKNVSERKKDLTLLNRSGRVQAHSNYAFGEGGAGTFSDGKLYTRSKKKGHVLRVLETFVRFGADPDILVDAHPHIGSDKLPSIIENIRTCILAHQGEVHFNTQVCSFITQKNQIVGVETSCGSAFHGPVILASGHSARDIYLQLHAQGIAMESKAFAVGVRLEHPQHLIDCLQYHHPEGRGKYLPAATYSMVTQVEGRGVYSFCMCPGGVIVPASTEGKHLVVNGMSASARSSKWANSGMVVEVRTEDLRAMGYSGLLGGMQFQKEMEAIAYQEGGGKMRAPAQGMCDFVNARMSSTLADTSYVPGLQSSAMHEWLPKPISSRLQEGFNIFNAKRKGFLSPQATLIGMESRTSSPLRIPRHADSLEHLSWKGLYPCGEGAGYAGGIVSAAVDGIRCALALAGD